MAWELAQLNIGRVVAPLDSPALHGFTSMLDHINQLAEQSPGFVWRLQSESGNATDVPFDDDPLLIANLSVWRSVEDLRSYVYAGEHLQMLRQRKQWFSHRPGPNQVLWWVPAGHRPSLTEAKAALALLALNGPTAHAFTFAQPQAAPRESDKLIPIYVPH